VAASRVNSCISNQSNPIAAIDLQRYVVKERPAGERLSALRERFLNRLRVSLFHWTFKGVSQSVVKIDPEIMSGAPCFTGTRVPIQNLIDYLEGGDSIDEFLEDFPSVSRQQVISFLEEAKESVLARAV